jgi:hypothetical protein
VVQLARHFRTVIFVLVGSVYFIIARFIREWDNHLYYVPHDIRSLWGWLVAGWILLQIVIVCMDYGNRYRYKFAFQFLLTLIVMILHNTIVGIAYFYDQGILDIVPFHDSYAGFLLVVFLLLIIAFIMKAWIKKRAHLKKTEEKL